ncbi:hypothetical protein G6F65_014434 [Rhizopus arrhizus]|nr:hypothetical protein G6F65_014434 [Rhizopus arrhizus]
MNWGRLYLIVHADPRVDGAFEQARARLDALTAKLRAPGAGYPAPLNSDVLDESDFVSGFTREGFVDAVQRSKEYIRAGDIFQVVLSQRLSVPFKARPVDVYRALRALNPSPYMYFLDVGDLQVVGSSPEILVRLQHTDDGVGEVTVRPIAGTRPRGATVEQDLALEAELLADPKERAEHLMLIDLGRNDAGRVSKAGTVEVGEQFVIERYSHVMHIVSEVTGQLQPGLSYADVLRATFPAGTVSGAPKIRALEVIRELEPIKRNVYAGSIGYIGWHGDADTAIAIRTAVIKDGRLYVQAGAGIVYDSDPDKEWDETMNKGRALFRAVAQAAKGLQGVPHEAAERIAVVVTAGHDGPVCVGAGQHHSLAAAPAGEGRGAPRGDAGPVRPAAEHRRDRHGCRCRAAPRAGQRRPRAGAVQAVQSGGRQRACGQPAHWSCDAL